MDPEYYDRRAAEQRKKLEEALNRRSKHEKAAANAEGAALKAEQAAARTQSASMRSSKLREAERKRNEAAKERERAAKASQDAAAAQTKVHEHEGKAAKERASRAKREEADRKRATQREEQQRRQREREQARLDAAREREVAELQTRTAELEQALEVARRAAPKHINVLLLAGTPEGGTTPLRLDREVREIDNKIRVGEYRDQIRFEQTMATQVGDIIDALNRHDPAIVHLSGHGGSGTLLFEGPDGRPHALRGESLGVLLQAARKPIRLVLFNACDSADLAAMATEFVDVAIGMDSSIGDDAAKVFAGQFYGSLAAGNSVGNAFQQAAAQSAVLADGSGDPRIFAADGVNPDELVLVAP